MSSIVESISIVERCNIPFTSALARWTIHINIFPPLHMLNINDSQTFHALYSTLWAWPKKTTIQRYMGISVNQWGRGSELANGRPFTYQFTAN